MALPSVSLGARPLPHPTLPPARVAGGMVAGEWGLLATLSVVWGSGTFFNALAVPVMAPLTVAFLRVALAAVLLWPLAGRQHLAVTRADVVPLVVMGLLNTALPFGLIAWGLGRLGSGEAGILLATTPIFAVLIAHVATRDERLRVGSGVGIVLGMAGVLAIAGGQAGGGSNGGRLAILGAALAYAVSAVYGRRLRAMPPRALAWGQLVAGALLLAPAMVIVEQPWRGIGWSWEALAAVAALAALSTAARSLVYCRLLASAGATNTSLVGFLIPASSLALGVSVLGEPLTIAHPAGLALIALGMIVADGKLSALRIVIRRRVAIH